MEISDFLKMATQTRGEFGLFNKWFWDSGQFLGAKSFDLYTTYYIYINSK